MNASRSGILFACIICSVFASGCATPLPFAPVYKQHRYTKNYEIEQTRSVNIGDPLFDVRSEYYTPAYEALQTFTPPRFNLILTGPPAIRQGDVFVVVGETSGKDGKGILIENRQYNENLGRHYNLNTPLSYTISIREDGSPLYGWRTPQGTILDEQGTWEQSALFHRLPNGLTDPKSFKAELIYSGLDGRNIKALYREYSGDYVRPAFSQELTWNLDESDVIAYKSVQLKIVKATNSSVTVSTIADGGLPWLPK